MPLVSKSPLAPFRQFVNKFPGTSNCSVSTGFEERNSIPATTFTLFPKLAAELREKIWLFALPPRTILYIRKNCARYLLGKNGSHEQNSEGLRNPTLLFVNRESRYLTLKHYSPRPSERDNGQYAGRIQYLDYETDIFDFRDTYSVDNSSMGYWSEDIETDPWIGHELARIERLQIVFKRGQYRGADFRLNLDVKLHRGVRHFKELVIVIHSGARFQVVGGRDRIKVGLEHLTGKLLDKSIKTEMELLEAEFLDFKTKNHNEGVERWKEAKLSFKRCRDCVDCKKIREGFLAQRHNRWKRRAETKERVSRKKRELSRNSKWNCG